MNWVDAEALLERVFPREQCVERPTKLMFESHNGPHNYSSIPYVAAANGYYFG